MTGVRWGEGREEPRGRGGRSLGGGEGGGVRRRGDRGAVGRGEGGA